MERPGCWWMPDATVQGKELSREAAPVERVFARAESLSALYSGSMNLSTS